MPLKRAAKKSTPSLREGFGEGGPAHVEPPQEAADMSWKDLERDKVASRLLNQPIQKRFPGYGIFNGTIVSWDASSRKLTTLYEDGNSDGLSQSIPAPVLFVQRMSVPCQALVDPDVDGA